MNGTPNISTYEGTKCKWVNSIQYVGGETENWIKPQRRGDSEEENLRFVEKKPGVLSRRLPRLCGEKI
jgi:hypothetical protein